MRNGEFWSCESYVNYDKLQMQVIYEVRTWRWINEQNEGERTIRLTTLMKAFDDDCNSNSSLFPLSLLVHFSTLPFLPSICLPLHRIDG